MDKTHGQQEAELQVLDRLHALQAGTFLAQDSSEALHGEERREGDHVLQRGQCQQPDTTSDAPVTERNLSLDDRLTFMEAKKKELESFFNNEVWLFDDASNAPVERVLKARFILNWKKNEDGTPRAKARLVVQGFKDPDALGGTLSTASPTLTRLSRNYILTVATMMGNDYLHQRHLNSLSARQKILP